MSRRRVIGVPEIVIAVATIAILSHFALPLSQRAGIRDRARQAMHDIELVRGAAEAAAALHGRWPADGAAGEMPGELEPYLPPGFNFERSGYRLDWDHWPLSDGASPASRRKAFAAVSVVASDARLTSLIEGSLRDGPEHFAVGNRTTVVVSGPLAPSR